MQQIAGGGVLVALGGRVRGQVAPAAEPEPAQDPTDGRAAETGMPGDAVAAPALPPQSFHQGQGGRRRGPAQPVRTRAAIPQASRTLSAIAAEPLAHRLLADGEAGRGPLRRQPLLQHRQHQRLSTARG